MREALTNYAISLNQAQVSHKKKLLGNKKLVQCEGNSDFW